MIASQHLHSLFFPDLYRLEYRNTVRLRTGLDRRHLYLEGQLYVERVEGPLVNTEDLEEQQ